MKTPQTVDGSGTNNASFAGRLRILVVTPRAYPDIGGVENHVRETTPRLAAMGADVTVLTTDRTGRRTREEMVDGVRIVRVRAVPRNRDYYFAPEIYRYVRSRQWDVVHCQGYHTLVFPVAITAARRSHVPCVVSFHSGGHDSPVRLLGRGLQHLALTRQLRGADRLICVSEFEVSRFSRIIGLPSDQFDVIPNGCDLPDPGTVEPAGGRMIASIGRLERYKGHHRLIGALPHLLERFPDVRAVLVGDGPYRGQLQALASRLGVDDAVEFLSISSDDRLAMARVMRQASLVVLLSEYESAGMAIVEAAGLGAPALVLDATALHNVIQAGLADAVEKDATDVEIAEAIASSMSLPAGGSGAVRVPTWDECAVSLMRVYEAVSGSNHSPARGRRPHRVVQPVRRKSGSNNAKAQRLRVVMVTPQDPMGPGGVERHVLEVSRRMVAMGASVDVLYADNRSGRPGDQIYEGVHIRALRAWPSGRDWCFAPSVWRELGQCRWDIAHIQSYHTLMAPIAMLRALTAGLPYVVTFHGGGHSSRLRQHMRGTQRSALRPLLARAGGLVALARFEIELYGEKLCIPADRFVLIPNGSDSPPTDTTEVDGRADGIVLASIGRLERYKGHHRAIAALSYVLQYTPEARLLIVGTGPYEAALRRHAVKRGVASKVEFTSVKPHDPGEMATLLRRVSLVLLLSDFETHPLVGLEAAAAHRRLLVSDRAGLRELARDGYARAVSPNASPRAIACAILAELAKPEPDPSRPLVLWDWDRSARALLDLYGKVIACSAESVISGVDASIVSAGRP